eukprot:TRINITY_DN36548_c0_g2_i1.p5 TRINITY_DN36548_c0_g2~~TRINITY_DN36548_c0_g2_i1.p5  ORF type:complete len:169 (+),score=46.48 TRINITY_DN36548_c0_g2_i1:71-508(+)
MPITWKHGLAAAIGIGVVLVGVGAGALYPPWAAREKDGNAEKREARKNKKCVKKDAGKKAGKKGAHKKGVGQNGANAARCCSAGAPTGPAQDAEEEEDTYRFSNIPPPPVSWTARAPPPRLGAHGRAVPLGSTSPVVAGVRARLL